MDYEFRVVVEKVLVQSEKVVKRDTIKTYDIQKPESILDLGLRHAEQISLLSQVQSTFSGRAVSLNRCWLQSLSSVRFQAVQIWLHVIEIPRCFQ